MPPIVSRQEWDHARAGLLALEKELTRLKDSVHIGPLSHLHAKDTSFAMVSRAPLAKLLAFRDRMGWTLPWVSSAGSSFNDDFGTTVDGEEIHAVSVFLRDGARVFHTWQTFQPRRGALHGGVRSTRPDPIRAPGELGGFAAGLAAEAAV